MNLTPPRPIGSPVIPLPRRGRLLFAPVAAGLAGALVLTLLGAGPRAQQQRDERERAMYVSVLDDKGAPVPGLPADAFVVREDGVRREVLRAERATMPLELTLLVDNTQASTAAVQDLRQGVAKFITALDERHSIGMVTFADRPTVLINHTRDRAELDKAVKRIFAVETAGSYLLDALVDVARGIAKRAPERAAIVVITTEGPEFSEQHHQRVVEAVEASGAALHVLVVNVGPRNTFDDPGRERGMTLDQGSRATGGGYETLISAMSLTGALEALAAELSNQYRIVYARPESLIQPQKVEVGVDRPNLEARGTPVKVRKPA